MTRLQNAVNCDDAMDHVRAGSNSTKLKEHNASALGRIAPPVGTDTLSLTSEP
jgi:hypothetical protein